MNISVSFNTTSLNNSQLLIVPELLENTFILEISPDTGCKSLISIIAYDSEFSVAIYVGDAVYVIEYDDDSNVSYLCPYKLWLGSIK